MLRCLLALAVLSASVLNSTPGQAAGSASHVESPQELAARLTPEQKQQFDQGSKAFSERRYGDALTAYKQLLTQLPGDAVLAKFAVEAALNTGEKDFAVSTIKPIAAADPNDWQAAALMTRACAETGDKACRDSGMAHLLDLHTQGIVPAGLQAYELEQVKVGENTLVIRTSLVPWGPYKVYDLGQVMNGERKIFLRISLESGDGDQGQFAKEYPKEAAQGLRRFSLDGYQETGVNGNGQRTQAHYTYKFFVGQPPYETVREEFINIASGKVRL